MKLRSPDFRRAKLWQILLACYWTALFLGTHLPVTLPALPGDSIDKLVHAAAFAVLAILLATTWQLAAGRPVRGRLWLVWTAVVLYGAVDEWTQGLVGRRVSLGDWLADAVGALTGLAFFAWMKRRGAPEE